MKRKRSPCSDRCWKALSPPDKCRCECRGKNHGRAHKRPRQTGIDFDQPGENSQDEKG